MVHFLWWGQERSIVFTTSFNILKIFLEYILRETKEGERFESHDSNFLDCNFLKDSTYGKNIFCLLVTLLFDSYKKKAVVTWLFHIENLVIQCGHFFSFCHVICRHIILLKGMWYDFFLQMNIAVVVQVYFSNTTCEMTVGYNLQLDFPRSAVLTFGAGQLPVWGPSCALQDIQQHSWPLPTRC